MTTTQNESPSVRAADSGLEEARPGRRWSRRRVLRALGIGGASVVVAGTGALGYRAYTTSALSPGHGAAYDPWTRWHDAPGAFGAVACAVLAASPHNTQPWTFAVADEAIDVYVDPTRGTGAVDPLGREQVIGVGCALENLVLGCRARGLRPAVTMLPDGEDGPRLARVAINSGGPVPTAPDPRYEAIGRRHTNRGPYEDRPLSPELLAGLVGARGHDGVSVHWVRDPAAKTELSRLLVDAAEALTADEQQSRDGFSWFRSNEDEVQRHRDGLVLDGQGLGSLTLAIAKLLPPSSRTDGDSFWVDQTRTVHTATAAAYGVITVASPDERRSQLAAGLLLQRIHLTATSRQIALHHMNQITERIDREATTGARPTFAPRFAALLPPGAHPLLTFRVGYPVRAARPTPRRSPEAVTR